PNISLNYSNQLFDIKKSEFVIGNSDFHLSGTLEDVGEYIAHEGFLSGDLTFTSDMTDVNELMDLFSGVGADSAMQADMLAAADKDESEGNPFIVPQNMNIALHTDIKNARIGRELAYNLGGNVYLQDGTVILEEIGFICQAAKLQLTGIYRTPRRNHIYLGADIHLLDIHIAEMLRMFPDVDTMLPMLSTFSGNAEFHMAVETYMNAKYELKPSTTIGALSIRGDSLELLDNQTFSKIARLLLFKRRGKMVADSISAEITLWNKEIDIYPFLIAINNYRAAVGGRHNLDMTYDYHVSLLRPLRLGVNARTKNGKLKIGLARCKYAKDFSPTRKNVVESQNMTLRDEIRRALKRTIKTE
ncbi:MAG: hypothetical protein IJ680_04315, partial [Paludibacteraceae bacterium]|nr:hypothetical protein [Paludibacteraceae bacterium]